MFFVHTRVLAELSPTSLIFLLRLLQQRMTERKQCENPSARHEGKSPCLTKAHEWKAGEGEGIGSLSNNLVYTKRQKGIYANRKHETTTTNIFLTQQLTSPEDFSNWGLPPQIPMQNNTINAFFNIVLNCTKITCFSSILAFLKERQQ